MRVSMAIQAGERLLLGVAIFVIGCTPSAQRTRDLADSGGEVSSAEGTLTIVKDVSFEVAARETVAIVEPSGAGKSTLLALLAGLDLPTSGKVWLAGSDLTMLSEDGRARLRAERVGFVFQSFHLVPSLTALENVMLPLELAGKRDARARAIEMLAHVGLAERVGH